LSINQYFAEPRRELEAYLGVLFNRYRLLEFHGERVIRGQLSRGFSGMEKTLARSLSAFPGRFSFEKVGDETYLTISAPVGVQPRQNWKLHGLLFLATVLTTLLAGSLREGGDPITFPSELLLGLPFSASIMLILLIHELGHYFAARHHGMDVSLPFFIPMPPPLIFGTAGALIKMRSPMFSRRTLLDVGAAGPLAGFLVSVPLVILGLTSSAWGNGSSDYFVFGNSLLFSWLSRLVLGSPAAGQVLQMSSVAFAGWIGFFVTAMNLIPLGQLDGGHIAYALFGRKHKYMAYCFLLLLLVMGYFWSGWFFWAFLILVFIRVQHPPIMDEEIPLDRKRILLGLATILVFILTFIPVPLVI
jgi:membrane-associated protease RseP (regulator of RpoE activity)